ncbi:MAG TPA: hypothetical protein VFS21_05415 [Roseiflexaceae bacterium]|nr:hypothetical protein [Roseiflexaceae bacterium]
MGAMRRVLTALLLAAALSGLAACAGGEDRGQPPYADSEQVPTDALSGELVSTAAPAGLDPTSLTADSNGGALTGGTPDPATTAVVGAGPGTAELLGTPDTITATAVITP